jgi:5-dehydro-2-deoxygluconokinase
MPAPGGDAALNARQRERLKRLSDWLQARAEAKFMFELLVPAEQAQLQDVGGDRQRYDLELRPALMCRAIDELQRAGIEPDVWKIEGLDRRDDCERIVEAARADGRTAVGCIVLGRGEDDAKVHDWLATAGAVDGFIGFAVGRTDFWQPLVNLRAGTTSRDAAVAEIARRYLEFIAVFEQARAAQRPG